MELILWDTASGDSDRKEMNMISFCCLLLTSCWDSPLQKCNRANRAVSLPGQKASLGGAGRRVELEGTQKSCHTNLT